MKTVAIIPARGGSKRIPRKNVRPFFGKPMIAWSIEAARRSGVFDRIVVSTDDDEIAEASKACGAEVPFRRPAKLSDDHATTYEVIQHAVQFLEQTMGRIDFACTLYATAPFVRAVDVRAGLEALRAQNATFAFSAVRFGFPIFRALKINERGRVEMFWPEHVMTRSQDLPQAYHDAAQFYWVDMSKPDAAKHPFLCEGIPIVLPSWRVQDIDTEEDWERAEKMAQVWGLGKD